MINGTDHPYGFGNKEEQDELDLDWHDFGARNYDAAIARWTTIDPITHFQQSTYTAFDNNPIYFADPSGTTTVNSIEEMWEATPEDGSTTWNADGEGGFCDDCPQEGESKDSKKVVGSGAYSFAVDAKKYYHKADDKWYFEEEYFEKFRSHIRKIGQGQASIETLNNYGFTDEMLFAMASWAVQAYDYYGGQVPKANGHAIPMGIDSPFFAGAFGLASKFLGTARASAGLYHYTDEAGYNAIMESGLLKASTGAKNARYGTGQYLTDIAPGSGFTVGQVSRRLFGVPWNGRKLQHFIQIETKGLKVIQTNNHIYLINNTSSLNISKRIISSGKSGF
ncbi:MAG: hypothetical protein HRT67_03945 [Flavobacteriaceae bacterium]|nr:hypothetical protein [Flavobacteriaceae bacterium]